MRGNGATRFMHLPPGTLFPKGEAICSNVKGAFFNPCFDLTKTGGNSFRGAVSGFGFASCEFVRRGGRGETVQASVAPASDSTGTVARVSIRRGHKPRESKPIAAPVQPVSAAPLPTVEQAGIRTSITP
jgi:hypothetical protein